MIYLLNAYMERHRITTNRSITLYGSAVPKDVYVGKTTLSTGVASAVISFNDGTRGV